MRAELTPINTRPGLFDFDFSKIATEEAASNPIEEKKNVRSDKGLYKVFILSFYFLFIFSINSIGRNIFIGENNCISHFTFLAEICDNGIDDDGDGLIDCADSDCTSCFEPDLCWVIADKNAGDDEDGLYSLNHLTGAITLIGYTGTFSIEAMAIDPINEVIYAMDNDLLGTINPATGSFTAVGSEIGNADGADGTINIDDVDGLTYDINNNILWGSERRDSDDNYLPDDLLIQIDPSTGQLIQNAFGSGIDYLVINTPENDLDDIAMADDGTLYAISNQSGSGNQMLGTINTSTGAWTAIGDYGISDVEGLAITSMGQLIATTGKDGSHDNNFYSIDPVTAEANFISNLAPGEDIEACACRTGSFTNSIIRGVAWSDSDGNGIQDGGEGPYVGITLGIYHTNQTPVLNDLGVPITTTTNTLGFYVFDKLPAGVYRVGLTLPSGTVFSPQFAGSDGTLDSDFNSNSGLTNNINLVSGQIADYIDAGLKIEEICDNGIDDDGDGLTDCNDPECGGSTVVASGAITICSGVSTTISAVASGGNGPYYYEWSNGEGSGDTKSVTPLTTTTYSVSATNANGCTAIDHVTIIVNDSPIANAGLDINLCSGMDTVLSASATGGNSPYNFSWSNGLGNGPNPNVSPNTDKTYTVTVTSANGCMDTDQVTLFVQPCIEDCNNGIDDDLDGLIDCADPDCGPTVTAGSDILICMGESTLLSATASDGDGSYTYDWGIVLGTGQNKTVSPVVTTTYTVTVTAGSGCTSTDEVVVTVNNCPEDCTDGIDNDGDGLVDCDDPDCTISAAPYLMDDVYTTCPGMPYTDRVTYNDGNLQSPLFSIVSSPSFGMVSIDATGKFTYTPNSTDCQTDQFDYEVCNSTTGCCAQATVTILLGDSNPPTLTNVPADITIGCDDAVPTAPVIIGFDECPGIYIDFDEISSQNYAGACESYTITRTWTATDLCGNSISESQIISVLDLTKPEIFQVYTLENGKKVVAGIARRVTQDWKYVPFPITFSETPMVFSTLITENEMSAVTVRQKNPYSQGFEMRLFEEENNDGIHAVEDVAWIAVEPGTNLGDLVLEAGRWQNIGSGWETSNFTGYFGANPGLITTVQSTNDAEPATVRINALGDGTVDVQVQEEQSADVETTHALEHIGYLAFIPEADLTDQNGVAFGETGRLSLTNAWTTVTLENNYTKPVVVFGGISSNSTDGVNVRIRNLTTNSFEVRLQEWDYLDGNHVSESVSWIAMEGAIPGNMSYYCSGGATDLNIGHNIFAIDNCDDQIAFGYNEMPAVIGNGMLTTRTWMAIDDCGNTNLISRYDTCTAAALQVRAMLHGAMVNNGNSALMRDDLRSGNLLPLWEPYSKLPVFPHVEDHSPSANGNSGVNISEEMVAICHKPGTIFEVTQQVPSSAVGHHLELGDIIGSCSGEESQPQGALTATYKSIADGFWTDPATWEGGVVPPTGNIVNKTITISHAVTVGNADLSLKNGAELWITNGSLSIINRKLKLQGGMAVFFNAEFLGNDDSGIQVSDEASLLYMVNTSVHTHKDFSNEGGIRWLENVNLDIDGEFINDGGIDSIFFSSITVEDSLVNINGGFIHIKDVYFNIENGGFANDLTSTISGDSLVIWAQNGNISNYGGVWTADIGQYCSSGSAIGVGGVLPLAEDCSGMADYFVPGSGLIPLEPVENNGGNETLSEAEIQGPGSMEPTLLNGLDGNAVVDWLLLELRDANDESQIVDYATVVLLRDGDVVSEDGDETIHFPQVIEGDYYVVLRHRNHLPLMTEEPLFLSILNPPVIDFTDLSLAVRGDGVGGRIQNGVRAMWGGDYNEDGKVIYQGPNNDVFYLFSRALSDPGNTDYLANYIASGYDLHDFNLDGNVIYQGPNNDRASLLYNSVLSHTGNNGFLANFIVQSFMP